MRRLSPAPLVAALALYPLSAPPAAAQDRHPIAAQVQAAVKDPAKPFALTINLKVKDGAADKFEAAFAKARTETKKEKGCLAYDLNREAKTPGRYLVYERWADLPALEAHLASAHFKALLGELGDVLDGDPEVKVLVPAGE
jgi:quinol monooxygenase YgiN